MGDVHEGNDFLKGKLIGQTLQLIKRECPGCDSDYKVMYYKRISPVGSLDLYDTLTENWFDSSKAVGNNDHHTDFEIYSSFEDAVADKNPWQFCNFNVARRGFPGACGKTGAVGFQWNSDSKLPP